MRVCGVCTAGGRDAAVVPQPQAPRAGQAGHSTCPSSDGMADVHKTYMS